MSPKSVKRTFTGFADGPRAIKYYDAQTRQIRVSRNYKFLSPAQNDQREGEQEKMDAQPFAETDEPSAETDATRPFAGTDEPPAEVDKTSPVPCSNQNNRV